jgi:hypothetical protein
MNTGIIDETEEWLPIGGLEPGFDEYKLPPTDELESKNLKFCFDTDSSIINYVFHDQSSLAWEVLEGPEKGATGQETYEAIRVAPDIYFVDFLKKDTPGQSVTIALDLNAGKATVVVGTLVKDKGSHYKIKQDFLGTGRYGTLRLLQDSP